MKNPFHYPPGLKLWAVLAIFYFVVGAVLLVLAFITFHWVCWLGWPASFAAGWQYWKLYRDDFDE